MPDLRIKIKDVLLKNPMIIASIAGTDPDSWSRLADLVTENGADMDAVFVWLFVSKTLRYSTKNKRGHR